MRNCNKEPRRHKVVALTVGYPASMASDHVPFYIVAWSPMLYVVCKGHWLLPAVLASLVRLGWRLATS